MNKQKKILLFVILLIIVLMGIGYASLTHNTLIISGTATASADNSNFKIHFTGEVPKTYSSKEYITVDAKPNTRSTTASVNILGLSTKDDSAYAILEIENESTDIDAESIAVTTNAKSSDLFEINVIMCDIEGNEITDCGVLAGQKTYAKIFTKLLKTVLDNEVANISATITATPKDSSDTPVNPDPSDDPISTDLFGAYYANAEEKMKTMTLDEKIAQMFVVGTDTSLDSATNLQNHKKMTTYQFGGHLFFANFFKNKTANTIKEQIDSFQTASKIPLVTSIDEEGNYISRLKNTGLFSSDIFKDSWDLYENGGFPAIRTNTINKSRALSSLGINLNFAPVVDITDDPSFYMYRRTLKHPEDPQLTCTYAETVIKSSQDDEYDVSYTLKHFPGYGNCTDTHSDFDTNNSTLESLQNKDLLPFQAGINAGAEVIMVSHNIISCMDNNYAASISEPVHNYLRNNMGYTGIIITDAINMGAIAKVYSTKDSIIRAIQSGNDMICIQMYEGKPDKYEEKNSSGVVTFSKDWGDTLTYAGIIKYVSDAVNDNKISQDTIDTAVKRIIAWKYYKGLLQD